MPDDNAESSAKCSRCDEDLDTNGTPQWCKKCRAKYQREYQALRKEMAESRGFAAGVSAARALFVDKFARLGNITFSGFAAAEWVRTEPGPPLPE